jgi:integrase/recombinase XerC
MHAEPNLTPDHLPVPIPAVPLAEPSTAAARLLAAFLAGRNPRTLRAYRQDVADFAAYWGAPPDVAAAQLLACGPGGANGAALGYRTHLVERGLAAATINRRLATLRSLVKLARILGLVNWGLEVEGLRAETYRDTRGPGRAGFCKLLAALDGRDDPKAIRDRALLHLLFDLALRRAEVLGLDLADLDLAAGTLAVLGKGRTAKVPLTLPPETRAALEAWVRVRGSESGPLFRSFNRARKGAGRLSGTGLYLVVRDLGRRTGLRVWPHALRHASITEALDLTGGDVRAVQKFSRHRDVRVLQRYDDCGRDLAGEVARKVAAGWAS